MFILKHVDIKEDTIMKMRPFIIIVLLSLAAVTQASAAQTCRSEAEVPSSTPSGRFQVNGDGTVTDKSTGLMWARCAEGLSGSDCATGSATSLDWEGALVRARDSDLAGYTDWRLPDLKELSSLVEERCYDPAVNLSVFPNTPAAFFWSATPLASDYTYTRGVHFFYGGITQTSGRFYSQPVRLVRSGQ